MSAQKKRILKTKREEIKSELENIYRTISENHGFLSDIMFDENRGHAGTETELALTTAEADLASAMDQIDYVMRVI